MKYNHISTEKELDGIIRRLDSTGNQKVEVEELTSFLQINAIPVKMI
jgi:Ca2+-binding EF-hand superfamily protein